MPRITAREDFDGFVARAERLGLVQVLDEVERVLTGFDLRLLEERHANGTKGLRERIDARFAATGGWTKISSGGVDWSKSIAGGGKIGVEAQVSGRSAMLFTDVMHLKRDIDNGHLDIGVIVVPDDVLAPFLTDRIPNRREAVEKVRFGANETPIRVIAFRHEGSGPPLPKMRTNLGRDLLSS